MILDNNKITKCKNAIKEHIKRMFIFSNFYIVLNVVWKS